MHLILRENLRLILPAAALLALTLPVGAAPRASFPAHHARTLALSMPLTGPDINFPKGYDAQKAAQIRAVLSGKDLHYRSGLISYWPPEWGTTLTYDGDTAALNEMLAGLRQVPGLHVALSFRRRSVADTGNARTGSWIVEYGKTTPNTLHVTIGLSSDKIDLEKLHVPQWGDGPEEIPSGRLEGARIERARMNKGA